MPRHQLTPVELCNTLGLRYQQFKITLLILSLGLVSQKYAIKAAQTNRSVPDIIIEIMPGASLRHRE